MARVRAAGRHVLFFTNGTGRSPAKYAADLRAVGLELADDEFMNPAVVAARWIARRHPGKSVLVLGGPGVVAPLHDLGIETVAGQADVVLVGWDDALTYAQLRAACESVWAGAPLLATSTAPVFSVSGGPAPGWSGAVVAGIRQTTGAKAITLGKPAPAALREMCQALGTTARRTLVVGDDLGLEIAMARRAGARTALVLTGISTLADVGRLPGRPQTRHGGPLGRRAAVQAAGSRMTPPAADTRFRVVCLAGDGIGPEVMRESIRALQALPLRIEVDERPFGGPGIRASGTHFRLRRSPPAGKPTRSSSPRSAHPSTSVQRSAPSKGCSGSGAGSASSRTSARSVPTAST